MFYRPFGIVTLALTFSLAGAVSCNAQHSSAAQSARAKKLAALKDLHDSGVLTDAEYQAKVKELQASSSVGNGNAQRLASLKELRDSGAISDDEYQQKVASLNGNSVSAGNTTPIKASKGPGKPTVPHEIQDTAFGIPWGKVYLPPGWSFDSGVVHAGTKSCAATGTTPFFVAESPNKLYGIALLPMLKTNETNNPQVRQAMMQAHCPMLNATQASDYLTHYILPMFHNDFHVISTGKEPNFEQMVQQTNQQTAQLDQTSRSRFGGTQHINSSARVLDTFSGPGGQEIDEVASAALSCSNSVMMMPMALRGQPQRTDTLECLNLSTFLLHMPNDGTAFTAEEVQRQADSGKSVDSFFKIEQNPAWQQKFQQESQQTMQSLQAENQANFQANQQRNNNQKSEFDKQQAIRNDLNNYTRNSINRNYQNHEAAMDHNAGAQAAYMGDYNVYTNPNTGQQVQLSNQYNNTYVNSQGSVALQTNSANSPGADWTQMVGKY